MLASLLLIAVSLAFSHPTPPRNPCANRLHLNEIREAEFIELVADNQCHVPVYFRVSWSELVGLRPEHPGPYEAIVQANSVQPIARLSVLDKLEASKFHPKAEFRIGTKRAIHDDSFRYAFPFGGAEPRRLLQGTSDGPSHTDKSRFAFDFEMPIGTAVLAARSGIVLMVADGFGPGGDDRRRFQQRVNQVVVLHEDGTAGEYAHLRKGVAVEEGQQIEAGTLLGYSGVSGYSSGPHLHFDVGRLEAAGAITTLPIQFVGEQDLVKGREYGPGTPAPEGKR